MHFLILVCWTCHKMNIGAREINRTAVCRKTGSLRNRRLEVMGARENGAREKDTWKDSARSVRPHILPPNACYAGYDTFYNCNLNKPRRSCMTWLCIVCAIRIIKNNKRERALALNQTLYLTVSDYRITRKATRGGAQGVKLFSDKQRNIILFPRYTIGQSWNTSLMA